MISLSYHYHNSRRREREALERKLSARDGRRLVDANGQQQPTNSGTGGGQKSSSASPRRAHTLKKQTSEMCVIKKTSLVYEKPSTAIPALNRPKRGIFSRLSMKKTNSFDNNNACQIVTSKSVEDLKGLLTVRETSISDKSPKNDFDSRSEQTNQAIAKSRTKSRVFSDGHYSNNNNALDTLGPEALTTGDVPLTKNICLAKPEVDSDCDDNTK